MTELIIALSIVGGLLVLVLIVLSFWTTSSHNVNSSAPRGFRGYGRGSGYYSDFTFQYGVANELWEKRFMDLNLRGLKNFCRIYRLLLTFNSQKGAYKLTKVIFYPFIVLFVALHFISSAIMIGLFRIPAIGFILNLIIFMWFWWFTNALFLGIALLPESIFKIRLQDKHDHYESQKKDVTGSEVKSDPDKELICPQCGKSLVLRNGKYGEFYGCSEYPDCRYTQDI